MNDRILGISGPTVTVTLGRLRLYEMVLVGEARLIGEVVRLERDRAVVQVYENTRGLSVNESVLALERPLMARLGPGLLRGMFDGLQRPLERLRMESGPFISSGRELFPLDRERRWRFHPLAAPGDELSVGSLLGYVDEGNLRHMISASVPGILERIAEGELTLAESLGTCSDGTQLSGCIEWPVRRARPFRRKLPPATPLVTGQRSIDFLFPLAQGGTAIFPGGFGTGKTILEQSLAKFSQVDIVIYVGCGERGNEMAEVLEEFGTLNDPWSGRRLMERTVVVANTSNMPVAAREASIYTAVTMGEYYRDMGYHVLLLADSISRWAEALREISSSLEEMPGEEGYPTYLASRLAAFMERAGLVETLSGDFGSLTMVLSVSPPGGDFTEPVTQACLRSAGAFLMLDTSLAHRRHFPAINWFQSYSLYESKLTGEMAKRVAPAWEEMRRRCRDILQQEESLREVAEIVGIEGMQDSDRLLLRTAERIRTGFLAQNAYDADAFSPPEETLKRIMMIVSAHDRAGELLASGALLFDALLAGDAEREVKP